MAALQLATEGDALLEMRLCQEQFSRIEEDCPKPLVGSHKQQRILDALRQGEELLPKLTGRVQLSLHRIKQP